MSYSGEIVNADCVACGRSYRFHDGGDDLCPECFDEREAEEEERRMEFGARALERSMDAHDRRYK